MATNNYFPYSGTQYAAANAAYQQTQAYGVPTAATGATTAASYSSQRSAYDAAYQTTATPVTYTAPAAVGVAYDSTKTYYQQAAPTAAAVAASTGQGAVTVGTSPDFQNWQQANYNARQTNAAAVAAVAAAANKVAFSYTPVSTTRQLTVPQVPPKNQTTSASPYSTQFANPQQTAATSYHYSNPAATQNVNKASTVGTIGQPAKKPVPYQQQKPTQSTLGMAGNPGTSTPGNMNMATATYNTGSSGSVHSLNTAVPVTAYSPVPNTYPNPNNSMYSPVGSAVRPKANQGVAPNAAPGSATPYANPYDQALINAAATMYMNQNPRAPNKTGNSYKPRPGLGSNTKYRGYRPPKPQQLHYCDACKISCAGPSAYDDHLQGQKHKKKVAKSRPDLAKSKGIGTTNSNLPVFICELCDIECTAADAYAAHLRGAKHTKVVKLHTKLGKPIPPPDPKAAAAIAALNAQEEAAKSKTVIGASNTSAAASAVSVSLKVPPAPRITFVTASSSNNGSIVDGGSGSGSGTVPVTTSSTIVNADEKVDELVDEEKKDNELSLIDDRPAVGSEYIEEEKDASGKLISFNCKLCECKFSDPNAKEMHMKGRKHRLQFKKKVDPKLKVEMKPNNFKNKRNEKWKKQTDKQKDSKRREFRNEDELKDYLEWCRKTGVSAGPVVGVPGLFPQTMRYPLLRATPRPLMVGPRIPLQALQPPVYLTYMPPFSKKLESFEDRYLMTRHKAIYPSEVEVRYIQRVVTHIEKALKSVSDQMLLETEARMKSEELEARAETDKADSSNETENADESVQKDTSRGDSKQYHPTPPRELTGVLRVGIIAKGIVLTEDNEVDLVMLCHGKPTMSLLTEVVSHLPNQLKEITKETEYVVTSKPADAAIVITTFPKEEPEKILTVKVTLTSTVVREEMFALSEKTTEGNEDYDAVVGDGCKVSKEINPDPPDVLSKTKCLEALAALRHAKWFQATAATTQHCMIIIRILRDICRRVPAWKPFNSWTVELLCEKVLSSTNPIQSPGDAFRRVFESVASGLLLPDGPGLLDPCEKGSVDATAYLTAQQREDITAYAQHALRLIAFRQIHKVLGMEPLPPISKFRHKQTARKRRRENSAGGRNEGGDGKKDKKETEEEPEEEQRQEENGTEEKMETDKVILKE